jgi:hypothetical protein
MANELTAGLDFQEDGSDFILSVTGKDGGTTKVRLSEDQVIALSQSAPAWRERIVLRRSPEGGDVSAVVVTPVTALSCHPDSLGASVLVTFQSATQLQMTYSLTPSGARLLLQHLGPSIAEVESARPTKQ